MSFRYQWLAAVALLGTAAASTAEAQRGGFFYPKRPTYGYFRYRLPHVRVPLAPRMRLDGGEIRLRALERSFDRIDQARERQFALQDRARARLRIRQFDLQQRAMERRLDLQDRALRRQLDTRLRTPLRMRGRMDRGFMLRPFIFRGRSRII